MTDPYGIILGVIGISIAIGIFIKQNKDGQKLQQVVDSINLITLQKTKAEQERKTSQCKRIIDILQRIKDDEEGLKNFLTNFKIGDPKDEAWKIMIVLSFQDRVHYSIGEVNDAMGQLHGMLNDALRQDFLKYLGWLNLIPKRVLEDKMPQKEYPYMLEGLVKEIDDQMKKIQEFIDRFTKEMESSLAEKHEEDQSIARGIVDRSKYFPAPKL